MSRLRYHLMLGAEAATLSVMGALDPSKADMEKLDEQRAAHEARQRAVVEAHIEQALPNAKSDWRSVMPLVEANVAGQVRGDLSRQEVHAMKREIAKAEATLQRTAARREARTQKKRRRAGVA